ncbi:sulfurtransferase TusA family protein [Methanococcus voltae]|uniref:tRNA 2-thiouridine synthesizing protein A n=2 Tax=Methanococcus voltae TaxID=2188 RepID=A0A8J7RFR5_METVO|nr:sulfurtransferase TusA family protein [Methanococcus voltae]MBP2172304.1 tRNA 2-thiouridine synthesizing protein A [Methanococcus voltae]MBP2200740.1 tRNA 2-thiouridine synthesizing protein A [Methanococcus voltae]MCS3921464.1 tRNA 2-thiouridine synthesizing protein A [Methanococcus voltae PS]
MDLDVSGTVCPMPVLKTKKALDTMSSGEELTVTGDYKPALQNIVRFVEEKGHKVISADGNADGFKVVILKN